MVNVVLEVMPEPVPLEADADGVVRVRGTRVTLDSVVHEFCAGSTPEEIAAQFTSVALPDIYAVLTYYLRHRSTVEAYLAQRAEQAERVRAENEARWPPDGMRARLLARRRG
jgi:uncharacterized protein (DUF433 family)